MLKWLLFYFSLLVGNAVMGQLDSAQAAKLKGQEAMVFMTSGKIDKSIELLEEAQLLAPSNIDYPYEIAYAYYLKKDFRKAIKILEKIINHKDITFRVFQLMGNSYDNMGNSTEALQVYGNGLKVFPTSGALYLESGVVFLRKKELQKALHYFEKGISVDPAFASNYYWATKIYLSSTDEIWGLIYGEIFMNLEPGTKRTQEFSRLLFNNHKSEMKFSADTLSALTITNQPLNIQSKPSINKPPSKSFVLDAYCANLILAFEGEKSIHLQSLNRVRGRFIDYYFSAGDHDRYPNVLFEYLKKIKDAGHMEAYNYWLFMQGAQDEFLEWSAIHKEKLQSFLTWFKQNKMELNQRNKFLAREYMNK